MHDKHQGSDLSGAGKEILFHFYPPPAEFYTEKSDSYQRNQRRMFSY